MGAIGTDRLFAAWIVGGAIPYQLLPMLTFVSAVMGGAVAGDHMSPISDTTVLSSLACDVTLMQHVTTQAPYVFWVVFFVIVFGYIPVGYGAYPNFVGMLLGFAASALLVYF